MGKNQLGKAHEMQTRIKFVLTILLDGRMDFMKKLPDGSTFCLDNTSINEVEDMLSKEGGRTKNMLMVWETAKPNHESIVHRLEYSFFDNGVPNELIYRSTEVINTAKTAGRITIKEVIRACNEVTSYWRHVALYRRLTGY